MDSVQSGVSSQFEVEFEKRWMKNLNLVEHKVESNLHIPIIQVGDY
jgi:hypothetical protein